MYADITFIQNYSIFRVFFPVMIINFLLLFILYYGNKFGFINTHMINTDYGSIIAINHVLAIYVFLLFAQNYSMSVFKQFLQKYMKTCFTCMQNTIAQYQFCSAYCYYTNSNNQHIKHDNKLS